MALSRHEDPVALVNRVYTRDGWIAQFTGGFSPVLGSFSWPVVGWSLRPDDSRMVHFDGPGRRRVNKLRSAMDHTRGSTRGGQYCSRCGEAGHRIASCPRSHPPMDRTRG